MDNDQQSMNLQQREALIRKAFYRSIAVIVALALAVTGIWYFTRENTRPQAIEEAVVSGPVTEESAPPLAPPPVAFTDITREAGIDFVHVNGSTGEKLMPETIGSGAAFLDYDNDGDQDLLLVNSKWWPGEEREPAPTLAFYRNDGHGRFTDVTADVGLKITCFGMGAAVGDYDNDGWTDLYITTLGKNYLFRNDHGKFVDVTAQADVAGLDTDWSTAAAFIDYDNDGDLDLFVGNYVLWSRKIDMEIDFQLTGLGRAFGAPNHFTGANNRMYRNEGDGRFSDVSLAAGIAVNDPVTGMPEGKTLGVAPIDYDRDGWIDLVTSNDTVRNFLYHNLGNGRFEEIGALEGIAYDRNGKATGAMGIDAAYFRNDSDLGVGIGNFANEMSSLFVTEDGHAPFADEAILVGFGPASRLALTFGLFFFDYDLDGRLDIFQANGHLEGDINVVQPSQTYAQPAQLFWNCGDACRTPFELAANTGDLNEPLVGRGAAYADIDGDGDLDIVVVQNGRRAVLFRNDQQLGHHWLRVKLEGRTVNRNAIGAVLTLTANGVTQRRSVMPTHSYLSQVELPVTFGLGDTQQVDSLTVVWPNGRSQNVPVAQVDTTLAITQPADE
jgi:enediyne biosynthesis protein E4